jgi:hypothetical protein
LLHTRQSSSFSLCLSFAYARRFSYVRQCVLSMGRGEMLKI